MPVGAVHDDRYRNAVRLGQQAAFDAAFASIRRIGAGFFPLPTGPSSSHRPSTTTPNQSHRVHRAPATPSARTPRTPRPGSTPGTADARNCSSKCQWHSRHSTDSPYAVQTKSRPSPHGRSPLGYVPQWMRLTRRQERFHLLPNLVWQTPTIVLF